MAWRKLADVGALGQPALSQPVPDPLPNWKTRNFGLHASAPKLIEVCLESLTSYIANRRAQRPNRNTGRDPLTPRVFKRLEGLSDPLLAQAVISGVIDAVGTPIKDEEKSPARAMKEVIGAVVERAWRGANLKAHHKTLSAKIARRVDFQSSLKDRLAAEDDLLKRKGIDLSWTKLQRIEVGNWAFHVCLQAIPHIVENNDGCPCLTKYARAIPWDTVRTIHEPTETPPLPWVWFYNQEREPFLRRGAIEERVPRVHMAAVNYLKSTPWTINERVFEFVKQLGEYREPPLLEFGARDAYWRRKSGRPQYLNRGVWSVFDADMRTAERYLGKTFYTDLACDFRGRIVPVPHFNYMRQDYVRGLFLFDEGKPIGKRGIEWLKVSTCNCFNENREMTLQPFSERIAWTERNMDRIKAVAADPWSGLRLYELPSGAKLGWLNGAADPIQFVAHCFELVAALDAGEGYITRLPLPFDATNSGAQHYSLLARDRDGARLTNLIYEGGVADVYTDVCDRIEKSLAIDLDEFQKHVRSEVEAARAGGENDLIKVESAIRSRPSKNYRFAQWWLSKDVLKRKFIKLLCIEALYGAGEQGLRKELRNHLMGETTSEVVKGEDMWVVRYPRTKKEAIDNEGVSWFEKKVRQAIDEALPGAKKIMDYVRTLADLQAKRTKVLSWRSPSGVPIVNESREEDANRMKLWLNFAEVKHNVVVDGPGLDRAACRRAAPPNLVHSLDAAVMALTANECKRARIPMGAIHDCFAWLGPDVDRGRSILQRQTVEMYEKCDVLEQLRDQVPDAPPIPDRGDLDLREVLKAQYLIN